MAGDVAVGGASYLQEGVGARWLGMGGAARAAVRDVTAGFWNPAGFQAGFARPYPIDKEGYVHAPTAAGLGIEWDPEFLRRHGLEVA